MVDNIMILIALEIEKLQSQERDLLKEDILIVVSKDIFDLVNNTIGMQCRNDEVTLLGCHIVFDEYTERTYYSVSKINGYKL